MENQEVETDEIDVFLVDSTANAVMLIRKDDRKDDPAEVAEWFPKSQIYWTRYNKTAKEGVVNIPLWLLEKKGW